MDRGGRFVVQAGNTVVVVVIHIICQLSSVPEEADVGHFRFGSDGARESEVPFIEMDNHSVTAEELWSNCTKQNDFRICLWACI